MKAYLDGATELTGPKETRVLVGDLIYALR